MRNDNVIDIKTSKPLDNVKKNNLNKIKVKSKTKAKDNTNKSNAQSSSNNFVFDANFYNEKLNKIDAKIGKIDSSNLDPDLVNDIIKNIDRELADTNKKLNSSLYTKEDTIKIKEFYNKFVELNNKLLRKIMFNNPFENFIYSEDEDKDKILKDFFFNINKDIHWLDLEEIDFTSSPEKIVDEKNIIISNELIRILESNLSVKFSKIQKDSLKNDFTKIASALSCDYDEIMEECNKIKTVTSTKLVSRPSYKNFISKSELNNLDPSKKISTIRFNFLNYVNLTEKQKRKEIANSLTLHMKSIKEMLQEESEELKKRVKMFYILIILSLLTGVASPTAGILCIITIGSAAAFTQTKLITVNDKLKKIEIELENISKDKSELIENTLEKMEITANELLENEDYNEVAELYKKKKKSRLNKKEILDKIEEQIRMAIINNLNTLDDAKKDKIIEKTAQNKIEINNDDISIENEENDKSIINVEIDL